MLFCRLLIFFKINFFEKSLIGVPSECETVWTEIRIDVLSEFKLFAKLLEDDTCTPRVNSEKQTRTLQTKHLCDPHLN